MNRRRGHWPLDRRDDRAWWSDWRSGRLSHGRGGNWRCDYRRRSWRPGNGRRCNRRLCCHRRRGNRHRRLRHRCLRTRRSGYRFFPLRNRLQHIARTGDTREIDLGFDFFFAARSAGRFGRRRCFRRCAEMPAHFFCFVVFQRTGMGLLLGDAHFQQDVENSLAFNFQFPGEIVNSNLAHPAFLPLRVLRS